MKCSDIDEIPILMFLKNSNRLCTWFGDEFENSVTHAMPKNIPEKLVLAKMKQMIKKGIIDGCACGCRGEFEITSKGLEIIKKEYEKTM